MENTIQIKTVIELAGFEERLILNSKFLSFLMENSNDMVHLKNSNHYVSASLRENPVTSFTYDFLPAGLDIVVCHSAFTSFDEIMEYMQVNNGIPLSKDNMMMLTNIKSFQEFLLKEFSDMILGAEDATTWDKSFIAPAHTEKLVCEQPGYIFYPEVKVSGKVNFMENYSDFYDGPLKLTYDTRRLQGKSLADIYFVFFKLKQSN